MPPRWTSDWATEFWTSSGQASRLGMQTRQSLQKGVLVNTIGCAQQNSRIAHVGGRAVDARSSRASASISNKPPRVISDDEHLRSRSRRTKFKICITIGNTRVVFAEQCIR